MKYFFRIACLLVLFLLVVVCQKEAFAADGSLSINNQVISDSNQNKKNSEVQELPDLFLSDQTEHVKKAQEAEQAKIKKAKAINFTSIKEEKKTETLSSSDNTKLFTPKWATSYQVAVSSKKDTVDTSLPKWALMVLILMAGIVAMSAGVFIGKKRAYWFRREKG